MGAASRGRKRAAPPLKESRPSRRARVRSPPRTPSPHVTVARARAAAHHGLPPTTGLVRRPREPLVPGPFLDDAVACFRAASPFTWERLRLEHSLEGV